MKHKKHSLDQTPAAASALAAAAHLSQKEIQFAPVPDEVARKAYFSYVNQGSSPGHEVQHWLEAEKQMLAERALTRTHGYRPKSSSHHHP